MEITDFPSGFTYTHHVGFSPLLSGGQLEGQLCSKFATSINAYGLSTAYVAMDLGYLK